MDDHAAYRPEPALLSIGAHKSGFHNAAAFLSSTNPPDFVFNRALLSYRAAAPIYPRCFGWHQPVRLAVQPDYELEFCPVKPRCDPASSRGQEASPPQ